MQKFLIFLTMTLFGFSAQLYARPNLSTKDSISLEVSQIRKNHTVSETSVAVVV